jgi:hypothetical protein
MKVILYIGHHKVGSTSLQVFLARNWAKFAKDGILYPSVETRGYALNLCLASGQRCPPRLPPFQTEPHNALAYQMVADVSRREPPVQFAPLPATEDLFDHLHHQVAALSPHTLILCAEAFSNFGEVDPRLITQLCDQFPDADFTLYCALRRPDSYLASWHGQRLKVGETPQSLRPRGLDQYARTIHFNYRTVLEPWIERVPEAQVLVRNYSDILASGGSIEDFAAQCGLSLPDGLEAIPRANLSLPLCTFPLMEPANRELPPQAQFNLSNYLLANAGEICPVPNQDIDVFGAPQREQILKRFQPIADYLSLAGQTPAFFPDLEAITAPKPATDTEAARALLDALDPDQIPFPAPREFIAKLKTDF